VGVGVGGNKATLRKTEFFSPRNRRKSQDYSWLLLRQIACLQKQKRIINEIPLGMKQLELS